MGEENRLALLLNKVCNIVITADLKLPILEGMYWKEQLDSGEAYDQSTLINVMIDGMLAAEYIIKLSALTSDCLRYLRNKYDSEYNLNKKKRLIRDDIQLSERGISYLNSRIPEIKINNIGDVKKLRVVKFNEIQKNFFNHVTEKVIVTSLALLKREISIELKDNNLVRDASPVEPARLKVKQEEPAKFEELFRNPQDAESCIAILRELSAPVVDSEYNYIGIKGLICVWVDCLRKAGLMLKFANRIYTKILNGKLNDLDLDGSEFTRTYKTAEEKREEITGKISEFIQLGRLGK